MNAATNAAAVILCAGKGTRMNDNSRNKVSFDCAGTPVIRRIVENMRRAGISRFVIVVGFLADSVKESLAEIPGVTYAYQAEQKGTGHAALCGLSELATTGYEGPVVISMGDKIIPPSVFAGLVRKAGSAKAVWGVQPAAANPGGGRVVTDGDRPCGVVEMADAALMALSGVPPEARPGVLAAIGLNEKKAAKVLAAAEKAEPVAIRQLCGRTFTADQILASRYANAGLYCFDCASVIEALGHVGSDNAQGEIYLTDALEYFARKSSVVLHEVAGPADMLTFSTRPELREISRHFMRRASDLIAAISHCELRERFREIYGDEYEAAEKRYLNLLHGFIRQYGDAKVLITRSPGRINLMGRHIDHRGGGVNVMAIDRDTVMVVAPRDDDRVTVANADGRYKSSTFSIGEELALSPSPPADNTGSWLSYLGADAVKTRLADSRGDWSNYIKAAVLRFQAATDLPFCGMDIFADGTVPPAAGLSSSSSLVVATAEAVVALNVMNLSKQRFVELCGEGEWYVGSRGGCGDHAAMKCAQGKCVTHIDFKPIVVGDSSAFDSRYAVLVVDSLQKARKSEGAKDKFNAKVAAYEFAFMLLKKLYPENDWKEFRDLALIEPSSDIYRMLAKLPGQASRSELRALLADETAALDRIFATHADPGVYDLRGVALYGISECARSRRFTEFLEKGDSVALGEMMKTSHNGDRITGLRVTDAVLEDLAARNADIARECGAYGCSTEQIDALCDLLNATPGVLGSEIVGAGLGGSVIALIEKAKASAILETVGRDYYAKLGEPNRAFVCAASTGSSVMF